MNSADRGVAVNYFEYAEATVFRAGSHAEIMEGGRTTHIKVVATSVENQAGYIRFRKGGKEFTGKVFLADRLVYYVPGWDRTVQEMNTLLHPQQSAATV